MQRGFTPILIVIILAAAAFGGYFVYSGKTGIYQKQPKPTPPARACSPDSKMCSDGSHVSRIPPNCDFAPCPSPNQATTSAESKDWKTYTNGKISFNYPNDYELKIGGVLYVGQGEHIGANGSCIPGGIGIYIDGTYYKNYDDGVQSIKANLDNLQIKSIPNGQLFTGIQKPGQCGDVLHNTALIRSQPGTIVIELLGNGPKDIATFNQILSTFKFLP